MYYKLFVPAQAVGANLVYFDLFNGGSIGLDMEVVSVVPMVSGSNAVSGLTGLDLFLTRTTAVGTGGTAATSDGTSLTAMTVSSMNAPHPLPGNISARLTPSGGATAGAVHSWVSVSTEETVASTFLAYADMVLIQTPDAPKMIIPAGTGIRVVQGSVASVGNIGFNVMFKVSKR